MTVLHVTISVLLMRIREDLHSAAWLQNGSRSGALERPAVDFVRFSCDPADFSLKSYNLRFFTI